MRQHWRCNCSRISKIKKYSAKNIVLKRRQKSSLKNWSNLGFEVTDDNKAAVKESGIIIVAVTRQQLNGLLEEITPVLDPKKHIIYSIVSGAWVKQIKSHTGKNVPVVRVMPNTAIAIQESMTCISADVEDKKAMDIAVQIFDNLGKTIVIQEELMVPATALCTCGIAFFLCSIRAASQGGIEIGFH